MDHAYKSQLQAYALKQNLDLPVYATQREGPAHAPRFRCAVTFSGQTFQCPDFFPTLKSAEHAAAKIALDSLAVNSPEVIDLAYKNLLQEIAQKENSPLPVYATSISGPSHGPTFTSTVEFAGRVFSGEASKTKKLAELSAAKVAFTMIKYGNLNHTSLPSLPCERQEAVKSNERQEAVKSNERQEAVKSDERREAVKSNERQEAVKSNERQEAVKSNERQEAVKPKPVCPDVPSPWLDVYENDFPGVVHDVTTKDKKMNVASPIPENPSKAIKMTVAAAASSPVPQNPTNHGTLNTPATNATKTSFAAAVSDHAAAAADAAAGHKFIMGTGQQSIPTGQNVVVRPWNPEMTLPQESEMLFRDDKFIAYRLLKPETQ